MLTFHPFIQYGSVDNYLVVLNISRDPTIKESPIEFFNSVDLEQRGNAKVRTNSATCIPLNDFGFTPNRLAVLGGDILILVNLLLVSFNLLKVVKGRVEVEKVESSIALFLPLYFVWTAFVTFGFPILFQYK